MTKAETASQVFREELLQAMGPERAKVTSHQEERNLVEGQTAAVWFSDNRVDDGRRICVVRRGESIRDIGFVHDLEPHGPEQRHSSFMASVPPFMSIGAVARFVLQDLFGDGV